jgi:hypothetical protein
MAAGDILIDAKAQLKHGQWLPWLKSAGITERTAQRYIRLARNRTIIEANTTRMSDLGVSGALAMLAMPRKSGDAHHDDGVQTVDIVADSAFNFWADLVAPEAEREAQKRLMAEAVVVVDKIGELPRTPELFEFLDQDPEGFARRLMSACDEHIAAGADEMGLTEGEPRQLADAVAEARDDQIKFRLVLKATADRDYHPTSAAATAIVAKIRDIAIAWLRRAESVGART